MDVDTKMLEDAFGWRGVLIEANPEQYKFLKVNRPRAVVVNAPVGNFTRVRLVGSGGSVSVKKGGTSGALALPLDTILKGVGVRRIDFLSLDVEGYELHILRTLSIPVSVLMVESDKVDQAELHALLAARGMRRVTSTVPKWRRAANDYYVAADFKPSASPPECAPVAPPPLRSSKGHKKKNKRDLGTDSVGTGCVKFVRTSPGKLKGRPRETRAIRGLAYIQIVFEIIPMSYVHGPLGIEGLLVPEVIDQDPIISVQSERRVWLEGAEDVILSMKF